MKSKKDIVHVKVERVTKNALMNLKYNYGFTSLDALLWALVNNSDRLKRILTQEMINNGRD